MPRIFRHLLASTDRPFRFRSYPQRPIVWLLLLSFAGTAIGVTASLAVAQQSDRDIKNEENQVIDNFALPEPPPQAPVYQPAPAPAGAAPDEPAPEPAPAAE